MEEENNQEQEYVEGYKIKAGKEYKVKRQEFGDKVFYKIAISKKNQDGTYVNAYKNVRFKDSPDIPDGTKIIPVKFIEDFYFAKSDPKHFNPIFSLMIYEWHIAENTDNEIDNAMNDYDNAVNQEIDMPF